MTTKTHRLQTAVLLLLAAVIILAVQLVLAGQNLQRARKENRRLTGEQTTLRADVAAFRKDRDRLQGSAVMWNIAYNDSFCGTSRATAELIARRRFPLTGADFMAVAKKDLTLKEGIDR